MRFPGRNPFAVRTPQSEILHEFVEVIRGDQHGGVVGADNDGLIEARIEKLEVIQLHIGQTGGCLHVDILVAEDLHEIGFAADIGKRHAVGRRVLDDPFDRLEPGHIVRGFERHAEMRVVSRQPCLSIAVDRPLHIAFAPVIGSQSELPVTELRVQLLEVVQSRTGAFHDITPLIFPEVLVQGVGRAGAGNKLPETGCLGR